MLARVAHRGYLWPMKLMTSGFVGLGHVGLRVSDLDSATAFYTGVLNLQVVPPADWDSAVPTGYGDRNRGSAMHLLRGQGGTLIALEEQPDERRYPDRPGLYHIALRFRHRESLGAWLRRYAELGSPGFEGAADHGVSHAVYLHDPEGNGIELYWDVAADNWPRGDDGKIQMYTHALDLDALAASGADTIVSPPVDVGHVHLQVSDIRSAQRAYSEELGFDVTFRIPESALFLSHGGYHHHLGLNIWNTRGSSPAPVNSLGLSYFTVRMRSGSPGSQPLAATGWKKVGDSLYQEESGICILLQEERT